MLKIPIHLDYKNPTRFEVEDLKKLIVKVRSMLLIVSIYSSYELLRTHGADASITIVVVYKCLHILKCCLL